MDKDKLDAMQFLSTPSARRATASLIQSNGCEEFLSTPSARRATHIVGLPSKNRVISIHALREEGDTTFRTPQQSASRFLSTPSARRATTFYFGHGTRQTISIHALREEGDRQQLQRLH